MNTPSTLNVVILSILFPLMQTGGMSSVFIFLLKQIINSFVFLVLIIIPFSCVQLTRWCAHASMMLEVCCQLYFGNRKHSCVIHIFGIRGSKCEVIYYKFKIIGTRHSTLRCSCLERSNVRDRITQSILESSNVLLTQCIGQTTIDLYSAVRS